MPFCQYSVDENNVIDGIGGNWTDFALENDGSKSIEDNVIGTSLWTHLHGLDVKCYLNAVFFAVRMSQSPILLPYRCDSRFQKRKFIMGVLPAGGKRLTIEHLSVPTLVDSCQLGSRNSKMQYSSIKCANCCSIKIGPDWLDPLVRPSEDEFPRGYVVCPTCKDEASSETARVMKQAKPF